VYSYYSETHYHEGTGLSTRVGNFPGRSLQPDKVNVTVNALLVLWQLFDKTAGDFPGVEIAASDLGLALQHLD
jgi:hypothetical protein